MTGEVRELLFLGELGMFFKWEAVAGCTGLESSWETAVHGHPEVHPGGGPNLRGIGDRGSQENLTPEDLRRG